MRLIYILGEWLAGSGREEWLSVLDYCLVDSSDYRTPPMNAQHSLLPEAPADTQREDKLGKYKLVPVTITMMTHDHYLDS